MTDTASVVDWLGAGTDILSAAGTIGAFATGFILIKRERDLSRSARVMAVHAFWRRTGRSMSQRDVQTRMRLIYDPDYCRREGVPTLHVAGPDLRHGIESRWYIYELVVQNSSQIPINTVEVMMEVHDGLGYSPPRWYGNTCPVAAAADVAPILENGRKQYFGFSARQSILPETEKLISRVAYPSRIAFPEPVLLTFIDGNGIQWRRLPGDDPRRTLSSTRKAAWRRQLWKREPDRYYWWQTVGER